MDKQIVAIKYEAGNKSAWRCAQDNAEFLQGLGIVALVLRIGMELEQASPKLLSDFGFDHPSMEKFLKIGERRRPLINAIWSNPTIGAGCKNAILEMCFEEAHPEVRAELEEKELQDKAKLLERIKKNAEGENSTVLLIPRMNRRQLREEFGMPEPEDMPSFQLPIRPTSGSYRIEDANGNHTDAILFDSTSAQVREILIKAGMESPTRTVPDDFPEPAIVTPPSPPKPRPD